MDLHEKKHAPIFLLLFQNITFYVSSGVKPGMDTMKEIVECAGGIMLPSKPSLKSVGSILAAGGPGSFVVITCDTDLPICRDFLRHKIGECAEGSV